MEIFSLLPLEILIKVLAMIPLSYTVKYFPKKVLEATEKGYLDNTFFDRLFEKDLVDIDPNTFKEEFMNDERSLYKKESFLCRIEEGYFILKGLDSNTKDLFALKKFKKKGYMLDLKVDLVNNLITDNIMKSLVHFYDCLILTKTKDGKYYDDLLFKKTYGDTYMKLVEKTKIEDVIFDELDIGYDTKVELQIDGTLDSLFMHESFPRIRWSFASSLSKGRLVESFIRKNKDITIGDAERLNRSFLMYSNE